MVDVRELAELLCSTGKELVDDRTSEDGLEFRIASECANV
jgi:hypothetical protein